MLDAIVEAVVKSCSLPENRELLESKLIQPGLCWVTDRFRGLFAAVQALALVIVLQCSMITLLVYHSVRRT